MTTERDELAKYKRGAKTLGEIIEKQCRDVLEVTGLHHLINEDGDGHWDAVWMRLFEMRDELADLKESTIYRERKRGDSWRDRAQERDSRAQTLEVELRAATERAEAAEKALEAAKPRFITTVIASDKLALTLRQKFSGWMGPAVSYEIADAVIAAGWQPPARTITTTEDLEALSVGAVVIDGSGAGEVYRKLARSEGVKWYEPSYTLHWESHELNLPAILIWDPRP